MNDRILELIAMICKLTAQHKQNGVFLPQMNQSESGVFLVMLQIMAKNPGVELFSLGELNSYLDYTRPNLSQTVNKLEDKNLVERVILKDDRRVTYIRLTDDGKQMLCEKYDVMLEKMNKVKAKLGEENTEKLIELLVKFIDAYEEI